MGSGTVSPLQPPGRQKTDDGGRTTEDKSSPAVVCFREASWLTDDGRQTTDDGMRPPSVIRLSSGWALEMRTIKTIERLVPVSSTHCCAYTPGLSTWWSTTALKGELVSRWVSRLDAFSGYPVRT